jgi:hypothetical protein
LKNYFKRIFKASTENDSLGNAFRQKRMQLFNQCLESLEKPIRILDIGGNELFWTNAGYHNRKDVEITILNLPLLAMLPIYLLMPIKVLM